MDDFIYIFENRETLAQNKLMSEKVIKLNQANVNILLVDDIIKPDSLNLMLGYFSNYHIAFHAANNREAIEILKVNKIDIIISDIQHPDGGMYELHRKLSADNVFSQLPVIVFSDYPMFFDGELSGVWKEILNLGYKYYLEKDLINEQLIPLLDQVYIENYTLLQSIYI
jgi:CheY-like chemotaxis protein